MAEKDLIPITARTKDEAQALGRLGGIASGKARRAKKSLSDRIKLALQISTNEHLKGLRKRIREALPNRHQQETREALKLLLAQARVVKDCGIDVYKVLKIAEAPNTQEIALKATNALWDREEGKPNQTTNLNHAGSITKVIHDDIK